MKNTTKLLSAIAAGMVLSTGAYAQDVAPASNLGPAVVGASQNGLFGEMGETGVAAVTVGVMAATFFIAANAWEDDEEAPTPPGPGPGPGPQPHSSHH